MISSSHTYARGFDTSEQDESRRIHEKGGILAIKHRHQPSGFKLSDTLCREKAVYFVHYLAVADPAGSADARRNAMRNAEEDI